MIFRCPVCHENSYTKQTVGYKNTSSNIAATANIYEYEWACLNKQCGHVSEKIQIVIKDITDIKGKGRDKSCPL